MGLIGEGSKILTSDINEGLTRYWQAISGVDQKLWYATEVYNRANGYCQKLCDESLEQLRTMKRAEGKKSMKNNCNYDILFNMGYQ